MRKNKNLKKENKICQICKEEVKLEIDKHIQTYKHMKNQEYINQYFIDEKICEPFGIPFPKWYTYYEIINETEENLENEFQQLRLYEAKMEKLFSSIKTENALKK